MDLCLHIPCASFCLSTLVWYYSCLFYYLFMYVYSCIYYACVNVIRLRVYVFHGFIHVCIYTFASVCVCIFTYSCFCVCVCECVLLFVLLCVRMCSLSPVCILKCKLFSVFVLIYTRTSTHKNKMILSKKCLLGSEPVSKALILRARTMF